MSTLTRNLLSNVVERGISTILTLVVLPFQVRLLGIDAYGILGFVASLQVLFNILDLGLGPTVIREIASSSVAAKPRSTQRPLFESLTTVYWAIALASGVVLAGSARWIAVHWLQAGTLPTETVVLAIRLIAMSVLLRWPVALYAGAMAGAQRLDLVNVIRIIVSVLKLLGGLAVLVYSRALMPYLLWLTLVSLLEIGMYMLMAVRVVPGLSLRPRFSRAALTDIWRFSLHMNVLSILAVLFVQADRMVISRILPIAELGFYSVAYSIVTGLAMLQSIVTAALFPALAQQVFLGQWTEIRARCRTAVQLLMYVLGGSASVLIFHGRDLLAAWISTDVAARSATPMAILAAGFTLSAAVSVPYTLSIAAGCTGAPLVVNIAAIVVYLPAVYWAVHSWGISGAAWSWLGLNTYYLLVLVPFVQRSIPVVPMFAWVVRNLCVFGGLGIGVVGTSHLIAGSVGGSPVAGAIGGALTYAAVAFLFLEKSLHHRLKNWRTSLITPTPPALLESGVSDTAEQLSQEGARMISELEEHPAFLPSEFWRDINDKNLRMLTADGLENFKRTLSQNYYNWLIVNPLTRHFRRILKEWLKHPTLRPLLTRIEPDVTVRVTTQAGKIALSAHQRVLYRLYVSCVWEMMLRSDSAHLAPRVVEPDVGNPIRIWRDGKVITQDLANSIVEMNVMARFLAPTSRATRVAELGAGSGRLAHVFAATQAGTYHIFDIPPALVLSQWYLERVFPEKRIFKFRRFQHFDEIRGELAQADLAFFTPNQLAKFPEKYFDMTVSISTLPEMRPDQVQLFLGLFQSVSRKYIYLKQWRNWRNPADGTALEMTDYRLDPPWEIVLDEIDLINPLFFNRVWAATMNGSLTDAAIVKPAQS